MTPREQQQVLHFVALGWSVAGAARKVGLSKDDILDARLADPVFAQALVEAMEAGAGAFRTQDPPAPRRRGKAGPLW